MKMIDNAATVAKKSIVMWLWYIQSILMGIIGAVNLQGLIPETLQGFVTVDDVIPADTRHWVTVQCFRGILACAFLIGPGRMIHQKTIAPKAPE